MIEGISKLDTKATRIFCALMEMANNNSGYITLGELGNVIEPLSVEIYDTTHRLDDKPVVIYAIQHSWVCNGDLMADPLMFFIYSPMEKTVYPISYQNDPLAYEYSLRFTDDGGCEINQQMQKEHTQFANQWMRNITQLFPEVMDAVTKTA